MPAILIMGIPIPTYIIMLAIGFAVCYLVYLRIHVVFSINMAEMQECTASMMLWATIGAMLLGAISKIPFNLRNNGSLLRAFMEPGLVFYGGLAGCSFGLYINAVGGAKKAIDYTDTVFRLLPLGQAFGRVGCFLSGCCYGKATDKWYGIPYVVNGAKANRIPVQLIEAAGCLMIALILLIGIKTNRRGFYTKAYLVSYACFRFFWNSFAGMLSGEYGLDYLLLSG